MKKDIVLRLAISVIISMLSVAVGIVITDGIILIGAKHVVMLILILFALNLASSYVIDWICDRKGNDDGNID